jgi:hypothetical protein
VQRCGGTPPPSVLLAFASVLAGNASVVLWIAGAWLALTCAALLVAVPALVLARRADESLEAAVRRSEREVLDQLAQIRAPSGTPFFPNSESCVELAVQLVVIREAGWIWDRRIGKEPLNPYAPGQSRGTPGALSPPG